jgi:hypothetical protein
MKISNTFILLTLIAGSFGCRSYAPPTVSRTTTTTQQITQIAQLQDNAPPASAQEQSAPVTLDEFTTNNVTYTIQSIPNPRLTPTSREGDGSKQIYSSNIIAVHVRTNNVTENSIDSPAAGASDNSEPQNK